MDIDFSTLLPIILAILYYVFTGANKNKKRGAQQPAENKSPGPESLGPPPASQKPTFEELLAEFTGQKTVEPEPEVAVAPAQTPKPNQSNLTKIEEVEKEEYKPLVTLQEDEEVSVEVENYGEMLASLDGAKRAFVASEIFNRKY